VTFFEQIFKPCMQFRECRIVQPLVNQGTNFDRVKRISAWKNTKHRIIGNNLLNLHEGFVKL